jgi:hypothetical protein
MIEPKDRRNNIYVNHGNKLNRQTPESLVVLINELVELYSTILSVGATKYTFDEAARIIISKIRRKNKKLDGILNNANKTIFNPMFFNPHVNLVAQIASRPIRFGLGLASASLKASVGVVHASVKQVAKQVVKLAHRKTKDLEEKETNSNVFHDAKEKNSILSKLIYNLFKNSLKDHLQDGPASIETLTGLVKDHFSTLKFLASPVANAPTAAALANVDTPGLIKSLLLANVVKQNVVALVYKWVTGEMMKLLNTSGATNTQ